MKDMKPRPLILLDKCPNCLRKMKQVSVRQLECASCNIIQRRY